MARGHIISKPEKLSTEAPVLSCWENGYLRVCLDNGLPSGAMRFFSIGPKEIFLLARLLRHRSSDCSSGRHVRKFSRFGSNGCCSIEADRLEVMEGKGFWPGTVAQGPIILGKNGSRKTEGRVVGGVLASHEEKLWRVYDQQNVERRA